MLIAQIQLGLSDCATTLAGAASTRKSLTKENNMKVCYLLGAGFSRQFEMPLMSDFVTFAKRIPREERTPEVEMLIESEKDSGRLSLHSKIRLKNIEDLLSFHHTKDLLSGKKSGYVEKAICDILNHCANSLKFHLSLNYTSEGWNSGFFYDPENRLIANIARWLASMLLPTMRINRSGGDEKFLEFDALENSGTQYGIVTLNYDTILESVGSQISRFYPFSEKPIIGDFRHPESGYIPYYKLHGSVCSLSSITPPTWQKGKGFGNQIWRSAYNFMKSCTHLRIIGYSMPDSDAYMKYFLLSVISEMENLEHVDVIDPSSNGIKKFEDAFENIRYKEAKAEEYLEYIGSGVVGAANVSEDYIKINNIEFAHERFFGIKPARKI